MGQPISTIRNLGPAMSAAFEAAGIADAETLANLGVDAAYARLLANGHSPHFMAYIAIAMGLQGRPWNDCQGPEKVDLRARFDAVKSRAAGFDKKGRTPLDTALADIGVIERPAQPTSSRPEKK